MNKSKNMKFLFILFFRKIKQQRTLKERRKKEKTMLVSWYLFAEKQLVFLTMQPLQHLSTQHKIAYFFTSSWSFFPPINLNFV